MKKIKRMLVLILVFALLIGCQKKTDEEVQYLKNTFYGAFDTVFIFNAYATETKFNEYFNILKTEVNRLHELYDKYNTYEGVNNIKTINDNAGVAPVTVDQDIIDLLKFSLDSATTISPNVNVALGPVLEIWHEYREEGKGLLPTKEELQVANEYTDTSKVIIDEVNKTVYLENKNMSLDVGAVAKGYAAELAKNKLIVVGCESFVLSAGGNIVSHGDRLFEANSTLLEGCKTNFCVSLTSPGDGAYENRENIAVILTKDDQSIVTSGDYQRAYIAKDGKSYHHLIDPDTLFPSNYMRSVTILTQDSGMADFLSTVVFLESYEVGREIVEGLDGVEAIWLLNNGTIELSSGLINGENIYIYE